MGSVFTPLTTCIYRAPAFSWERISPSLEDDEVLHNLLAEADIAEAIRSSAPKFWAQYTAVDATGPISAKMKRSLRQYLIRMSTRATPNRLFAGIGEGKVCDLNDLSPVLTKKIIHTPAATSKKPRFYTLQACVSIDGTMVTTYSEVANKYVSTRYVVSSALTKFLKTCATPVELVTLSSRAKSMLGLTASETDALIKDLITEKIIVGMCKPYETSSSTGPQLVYNEELQLKTADAQRLLDVSEKLRQISPHANRSVLLSRLEEFLDKNSAGRPYPLLDLSPSFFDIALPSQSAGAGNAQANYVLNKLQGMKPGEQCWALTPEDLVALSVASPAPAAIAALAQVTTGNDGTWDYTLVGAVSASAGRILGRFGRVSKVTQGLIEQLNSAETRLEPSVIHAAIAYDFQDPVLGALAQNNNSFSHFIDFGGTMDGSKTRIPFSDLAFVRVNERVALISVSLKRELKVHFTHTCNPLLEKHYYYRLLSAFEHGRNQHAIWNWGIAEEMASSLPRVVLDGVVVKRARWILRRRSATKDQLLEEISARGMPRQFMAVEGDQRLYVDLSVPSTVDILFALYQSAPKLVCEESRGPIPREIEVVVCGTRQKKAAQTQSLYVPVPPSQDSAHYTYLKLYAHPDSFDSLIAHLAAKLNILVAGPRWFVVRYADPQPHLRFRLQLDRKSELVRSKLSALVDACIDQKTIWRLEQATYERETVRYGGMRGVELYEQLAHLDSQMLASFLRKQRLKFNRSDGSNLALALELIEHWLPLFYTDREERREVLTALATGKSFPQLRPVPTYSLPKKKAPRLTKMMRDFQTASTNWDSATRSRFVGSVLHMSLNRWGITPALEATAYKFALKELYRQRSSR